MHLADELRLCLQELLSAGTIEIRETGGRRPCAAPVSWEVRGTTGSPLLHLWSHGVNLTRRVSGITARSAQGITLAVERFGRGKPERLEIVRLDYTPSAKTLSRAEYCEQLRRILAGQFPDETVEQLSIAQDLEHSLSRVYARGVMRRGALSYALLAVPESESPEAIGSGLTHALLWLQRARQTARHKGVSVLRLILPKGKSSAIMHRLAALDPQLALQIYELDSSQETLERVAPQTNGNCASWLVPRRESQLLLDRAAEVVAPIVALAPDAISLHPVFQSREVVLRFRGQPFAGWRDGRAYFGTGAAWAELTSATENSLRQTVLNLRHFRAPLPQNMRHPLYRAQPERWLQSLIMQDVTRVDFQLDREHVYEQVIAESVGHRGILDLLTVTRQGRLAILELKTTEDLDLPLQAAEYWSRIRGHQLQGDLARYGYFPGVELQSAPPLVYLITPVLRFHPSTDILLRYLSPEMEVRRVGLAENWRSGVRVMIRQ